MSAFRLALFELRRFRGPLRRSALAFLLLVPTLYAGVYLWSSWDPYGRADRIPVAVVNLDRPATANGKTITAGRDFTDQLRAQRQFDWRFVSGPDALDGLKDGRYYFVITVPRDFSSRLTSAADGTPQRAALDVKLDDANGYVVGIIAKTAQSELQSQVNVAAQTAYVKAGLGSLQDLRSGLQQAAGGATKLKSGAQQAHAATKRLSSGLGTLERGAGTLADGSAKVASGTQELADVTDAASSAIDQVAGSATARVKSAVADGRAAIDALVAAHPELASDPALQRLRTRVEAAGTEASSISSDAAAARRQVGTAVAKVDALNRGAHQVAGGAVKLRSGIATAQDGAAKLSAGDARLADGALRLARKLTDAYKQLPAVSAKERARNADVLANPVAVRSTNLHPARVYGRGVAPFFLSIGLWVFGLVAYILLRPVAGEALASGLRSPTVAIGAWLPSAMLGTAAATLLFAVAELGLGLDADRPLLLLGLLWLSIWAFTAIDHALRVGLGPVGEVVTLVLLVLQLGGSGGLYPLQISPGIFDAIHPLLPMTYTIDAFRYAISGGEPSHAVRDVIVVCGFLLLAVGAAIWAVARQRAWTIARLRPELEI